MKMEEMESAFEEWAFMRDFDLALATPTSRPGKYASEKTKGAWLAWAALAATPQPSADMVLVPREPTDAIIEAFAATGGHHPNQRWPAILAVATTAQPAAPTETGGKSFVANDEALGDRPDDCDELGPI